MGTLQVASGPGAHIALDRNEVNLQESQALATKVEFLTEQLRAHPDFSDGQPLRIPVRLTDGQDWMLEIRDEPAQDSSDSPKLAQIAVEMQGSDGKPFRTFRYDQEFMLRRILGDATNGVTVVTDNEYKLTDTDAQPVIAKMAENIGSIAEHVAQINEERERTRVESFGGSRVEKNAGVLEEA